MLDVLPPELAEVAFENMRTEVAWNVMYHRGMSSAHNTVYVRSCRTIISQFMIRWGSAPAGGSRGGRCCGRKVSEIMADLWMKFMYIYLFLSSS